MPQTANRLVQIASMPRRAFRRLAAMVLHGEAAASVPTKVPASPGSRRARVLRRDPRDAGAPRHFRRGAAS